ncbi:hypothetical protein CC86DRAFT_62027 [Ophiobolus disseminans]|uniref:Uncharacterized protein n=1 Tax=Ophiobolus disseminans TaxID=1469910 RepID=A0A6A6ZUE2_9PLEO|nr:hypothetical protein CC86DRAFT_62027 [Ophiobolus disseminans]
MLRSMISRPLEEQEREEDCHTTCLCQDQLFEEFVCISICPKRDRDGEDTQNQPHERPAAPSSSTPISTRLRHLLVGTAKTPSLPPSRRAVRSAARRSCAYRGPFIPAFPTPHSTVFLLAGPVPDRKTTVLGPDPVPRRVQNRHLCGHPLELDARRQQNHRQLCVPDHPLLQQALDVLGEVVLHLALGEGGVAQVSPEAERELDAVRVAEEGEVGFV